MKFKVKILDNRPEKVVPESQRIWTPGQNPLTDMEPRSKSASGCGPSFVDLDPVPNFPFKHRFKFDNEFYLQAFCQYAFQ